MVIYVKDLNSSGVDVFANLTERELRNNFEKEVGIFIAESPNVIKRAVAAGYEPISFLMEEKHITGDGAFISKEFPDLPLYTAERSVLEKITGYKLTRGVLGCFKRKNTDCLQQILSSSKRIAVLENIADTSNLGAIFRSAAALNFDAVLLTPECADPLNRRCLRTSMGNVFNIKWCTIGKLNSDWPENGMKLLKESGFKTVSMALRKNSVEITDKNLLGEEKLAVILGTEGEGLKNQTIDLSDYVVKIPMKEGVDSLNVACAATVMFYQLSIFNQK